MDVALLKGIAEIGVVGVLVFVVFNAYRKQNESLAERLAAVISNNTAAITKLCDSTAATAESLNIHDARAERIETAVSQVVRVVDRTEAKVNEIASALKAQK